MLCTIYHPNPGFFFPASHGAALSLLVSSPTIRCRDYLQEGQNIKHIECMHDLWRRGTADVTAYSKKWPYEYHSHSHIHVPMQGFGAVLVVLLLHTVACSRWRLISDQGKNAIGPINHTPVMRGQPALRSIVIRLFLEPPSSLRFSCALN